MVDYHMREKISHSGKRISPEMKSRVIFFFQSVVIYHNTLKLFKKSLKIPKGNQNLYIEEEDNTMARR